VMIRHAGLVPAGSEPPAAVCYRTAPALLPG
jgi:hypothetical protein